MSTFIIESTDFRKLSNKMLYMVVRNVFKHGVKEVKLFKTQVHLYLQYHPKNSTIEAKLGMLPVKYIRVQADNEEELQLFFRALNEFPEVKRYLMDRKDQEEEQEQPAAAIEDKKKIKILENRLLKSADKDEQQEEPRRKKLKQEEVIPSTSSSSSSTATYIENFNPDDDFESQMVKIDDLGNLICINN